MKHLIYLISLSTLFVSTCSFCQSDTLSLTGTTIIPNTSNQQLAMNYGFILKDVENLPCDETGGKESLKNEIFEFVKTDTLWQIEVFITGNCCHSFLCDISIEENNTLNLISLGYGSTYCSCTCCFGLTYLIEIESFTDNHKDIQYVTVNGLESTKILIVKN